MRKKFLQPGDFYIAKEPTLIRTVLGSCVSVVLYDPKLRAGAMNHIVLPAKTRFDQDDDEGYFAESAVKAILKGMKKLGSQREDLVVKVIGGAYFNLKQVTKVGELNVAAVMKILRDFGLKPAASKTGGSNGYKVLFNSETGLLRFHMIQNQLSQEPVKLLVVDDSKMARETIKLAVKSDPKITVVGEAEDPIAALDFLKVNKVDVLTLDINMPRMDGIRFLREYQRSMNLGIVVVNDYSATNVDTVFQALAAGAVEHVKKPELSSLAAFQEELINKIHATYLAKRQPGPMLTDHPEPIAVESLPMPVNSGKLRQSLIAIGASTGGTEAIAHILQRLPASMPPIVIVIHMPPVFSFAFAQRLNKACQLEVKEAENGDVLKPGHVYIAPGDFHLELEAKSEDWQVKIQQKASVNSFRPSVDVLFRSVERHPGHKTLAILLTGMGRDGAEGLKRLFDRGAMTVAQDEESCVVFGMPREAIERGAARKILHLNDIPRFICQWLVWSPGEKRKVS
ncbi:MAG: chemotaxis-specific protein-glutamate methyltransferase CheB [Oligoflexus sp.]